MDSGIVTGKGSGKAERMYSPSGLNKRLYNLKEAATYLGRPVFSVRGLIWKGLLPVIKNDGDRKMYLDIHDMDSFIEKNRITIT